MDRNIAYHIERTDEISTQKMQFTVINRRPKYATKDVDRVRAEIERQLFEVFQKYEYC